MLIVSIPSTGHTEQSKKATKLSVTKGCILKQKLRAARPEAVVAGYSGL